MKRIEIIEKRKQILEAFEKGNSTLLSMNFQGSNNSLLSPISLFKGVTSGRVSRNNKIKIKNNDIIIL